MSGPQQNSPPQPPQPPLPHCQILFLCKRAHSSGGYTCHSSGLRTSSRFVVDMLRLEGVNARLVEVVDGNDIDRVVTQTRPQKVVLEAIWVTPKKLAELMRLHPTVKWTVRVHSETPFLSNEGMAVEWIDQYFKLGVQVGFNSDDTANDFRILGLSAYLPNYYPLCKPRSLKPHHPTQLHIGCFGAIRPMKNQLIQAMAAVRYAEERRLQLFFHMNGSRIEQSGDNNLKNIVALFDAVGQHLVLHPWMAHDEFLELIATMDLCLQVSLSESFNIVSADAVSMSVPLVGSSAVKWLPDRSRAEPDSTASIIQAMQNAGLVTVWLNHEALKHFLSKSKQIWLQWASC